MCSGICLHSNKWRTEVDAAQHQEIPDPGERKRTESCQSSMRKRLTPSTQPKGSK